MGKGDLRQVRLKRGEEMAGNTGPSERAGLGWELILCMKL